MSVDISMVIISLNSRRFVRGCIDSLRAAAWRAVTYEIVVVDNGSSDGTLDMLGRDDPDVVVLANAVNEGFCKAGNQGARRARGRHLLFLNDDTLILGDAVTRLVEWLDDHPQAGAIGSRLLNSDGTDQFSSGRRFTTPSAALFGRRSPLTRLFPDAPWARSYLMSDRIDSRAPYEVDWLSAAAMMVRRDAFEAAGGLAEDYYYFHEQIFFKRLKDASFGVFLDPESKIIHHEGVGSGVRTRRVRRRHIQAFHQAAWRWYCDHHNLGPYHPVRAVAALLLSARACALIAADMLKRDTGAAVQLQAGRPEGGVAL
jgi:N-acetylglucosaminyl-diphospho-decaprenol L-rhamnosyltransferase